MVERLSLTEAECQALCYRLAVYGCGVFANDASDDISDPGTRAAAKLFAAAGKPVPDNLAVHVADISTLGLPSMVTTALKDGHVRIREVPLPRQITCVYDLCEYSAAELIPPRGILWEAAIVSIRTRLAEHGLKLKGD